MLKPSDARNWHAGRRYPAPLAGILLLLGACQSDAEKLDKLDSERTLTCLLEQSALADTREIMDRAEYRRIQSEWLAARQGGDTASEMQLVRARQAFSRETGLDTLLQQWTDYKNRCAIATRDYERMLR